jgi:hypothetical protein
MPHRSRRVYDHRIKEQIIRAGNPDLLPQLEIPRSTAVSWIRRGPGEVVSLDPDGCEPALRNRVAKLEGRVARRASSAWCATVKWLARRAPAVLQRRARTSPHDMKRMPDSPKN